MAGAAAGFSFYGTGFIFSVAAAAAVCAFFSWTGTGGLRGVYILFPGAGKEGAG